MSLKTAIHDLHVKSLATMVEFAGYMMPVQYKMGIIEEHNWTRTKCGIFDVSHMGQVVFKGIEIAEVLSKLTPADFPNLKIPVCKYTLLMNENGGIVDDLIVTKLADDYFFVVLNASRKNIDLDVISKHLPSSAAVESYFDSRALIAVQGPQSFEVLSKIFSDIGNIKYMQGVKFHDAVYGDVFITRTGYTGEWGYEVSIVNDLAPKLWEALTQNDAVRPIGLGARDSLRLEAGYPLYGNDIDLNTTPVEASLEWVISKNNTSFIGSDVVLKQIENGAAKRRTGVKMVDRGILRHDYKVFQNGEQVGVVTSGGYSPTLSSSIGMCAINSSIKDGEVVEIEIRGKMCAAQVSAFPMVQINAKGSK